MGDGVDIAEGGKAFAHALFLDAGKIDVLHGGVGDFLRIIKFCELQKPRLGNFCYADMGGLCALGVNIRLGQDTEQSGFSYLGQSNNACLHESKDPSLVMRCQETGSAKEPPVTVREFRSNNPSILAYGFAVPFVPDRRAVLALTKSNGLYYLYRPLGIVHR